MTSKQHIRVLETDVYEDMRHNFSKYSHLYKKANSQERIEFFEKNSIDTEITFDMPDLNLDNEDSNADIENAKKVYQALDLSLTQAADMRIWTYLCGTAFYEYIYNYLGAEKVESEIFNKQPNAKTPEDVFKNMAPTSFLSSIKSNTYRALAINYVSRLWWAAQMCEDNGDFTLLAVLNPLPGKMTLTRKFFNNKKIAHAALKALYKFYQNDNNGDFSSRPIYNVALKVANIISSSKALDVIPEQSLENEIYRKMKDIIV